MNQYRLQNSVIRLNLIHFRKKGKNDCYNIFIRTKSIKIIPAQQQVEK